MSCSYPSCMRGGGSCDSIAQCEADDRARYQKAEEKSLLDLEEQKLRIELLKKQIKENL